MNEDTSKLKDETGQPRCRTHGHEDDAFPTD